MADITIVASDVAPVEVYEQMTGPAEEAIDAGEMVRLNTTTGELTLANASSAAEGRTIGMAIKSGGVGQPITVVKRGLVNLGDALDAEDFDEELNLSDTDGALDDGDGVPTGTYPVGRVVPAWGATSADKILFVDIPT